MIREIKKNGKSLCNDSKKCYFYDKLLIKVFVMIVFILWKEDKKIT